ncbi:hypothetical protein KPL37_18275 [Clostridium frigoris]|uniref:Uncharacterized protein n=1 Tax=Clostridium frigoris TaxID=205327 RepID=A0ABS6BYG4_9CLOT|nr:hypothetical protein [Clostridium frigoris]MBU3161647.1 hypothetical protein [Clostridium frigoris]
MKYITSGNKESEGPFSNGDYEKDLKKASNMKLDKQLKRLMKEKYENVLFNEQLNLQDIVIYKDELEEEERNSTDSKMKQRIKYKSNTLTNALEVSGEYIYKSLMIYGLVATEHDFARIVGGSVDEINYCIQKYNLKKHKRGYIFILLTLCGELEDFNNGVFFEVIVCNIISLGKKFGLLLDTSKNVPGIYKAITKEYELYPTESKLCLREYEVLSAGEEVLQYEQLEVVNKIGAISERYASLERVPEFNCLQEGA